jgi:hypothetical protein
MSKESTATKDLSNNHSGDKSFIFMIQRQRNDQKKIKPGIIKEKELTEQ